VIWEYKPTIMREHIVDLEHFAKTEQDIELDRIIMQSEHFTSIGKRTLLDDVESTYLKYMWKYGSTNIKVRTDKVAPRKYRFSSYETEIIKTE
jgi:hypothetical protein